MELFPAQPDLSLKISPPNKTEELDPKKMIINQNLTFDLSLSYSNPPQNLTPELNFLRPIKGIPIYQNTPLSYPSPQQSYSISSSSVASSGGGHFQNYPYGENRSRFMGRFNPSKRSMRAPRMRWTTTLHSRFVRAVELLGGHERATPKSVLELMDVKDLTLAHVKSHLQMYRTIKTTDRAAASSEQFEVYENGSSGDTYEDIVFENPNQKNSQVFSQHGKPNIAQDKDYHCLWSNSSSREACGKRRNCGDGMPYLEDLDTKCLISDVTSSSLSYARSCPKKPNLEFTLAPP